MKYEFIDEYRSEFTVVRMCKAFRVKESGYYRWRNKKKTDRQTEDEALTKVIREVHQESKRTYGPKRIQEALLVKKITCCLGRIRRLMRESGLYCISRKKSTPYPKETIEKRFSENVLDRVFNVNEPDEVWCGDITYVKTVEGWVYIATVIDLFNREVVGYALSKKPNSQLTMRAMAIALTHRKPQGSLLFHSDRGCQYSSKSYHHYLEEHQITSSMSRGGNPYDNACAESFFATLKKEWVHHRKYQNLEHLERSLFEYIDLFYNRKRLHSRLENLSPVAYYKRHKDRKIV
jgi:putative transposase